jgi:hypothetical protein
MDFQIEIVANQEAYFTMNSVLKKFHLHLVE